MKCAIQINLPCLPFFVAGRMPVTRPLLSCSPFLSFQSALRASGQSCAQCPSFLHNLHFVPLEKSCSLLAHTVHISCAALICTTASCVSLSPSVTRATRACASCCGCLAGEQSRSGSNFSAPQLSHWVDVFFVFWRCWPHRILMWETQTYCELIGSGGADTHTDPLSDFSFFLPANSFCTFHFSFLLTLSALAFFLFYLLP